MTSAEIPWPSAVAEPNEGMCALDISLEGKVAIVTGAGPEHKGGLANFIRAAVMDLAPYGIRVNTAVPAPSTGPTRRTPPRRPAPYAYLPR